jgi:membrane associated rhomboid family serine protease
MIQSIYPIHSKVIIKLAFAILIVFLCLSLSQFVGLSRNRMESTGHRSSSGVPPVTGLTIVALVVIFVVHSLTGEFKVDRHTIRPEHSFEPSKWYRFFTSPLVHSNLLYLVLSVIGLLFLGTRLERKLGTMMFLYTQVVVWIGSVTTFCTLGSLLYFLSAYDSWMEAKNTGFGPILFSYAVMDAYIGRRDTFRIIAPWLLALLIPMALHRVSILSAIGGCLFGLLLTRGGLGRVVLPTRASVVRAEESWAGRILQATWASFCPVWSESSTMPFEQSMEGPMFSDLHPTHETIRLIPMSSKDTSASPSTTAPTSTA